MTSVTTLEEANAELTLRLRQQELATEYATFGLKTFDLEAVLHEACRVAAKGMECSFAKVLEYLPSEHCFLLRAGIGWRPGVVGHARLGADLQSPAGYAFQTGQPVLSNHLAGETRFRTPDLLMEHGVHRAFNVLVQTPDTHYGVLEVDSPDQRDFTLSDTAFLQNLAVTLAHAIAHHRRLQDLVHANALIQSVLDASPDCVTVLDRNGALQQINDNGRSAFEGAEPGQPFEALWSGEERERIRQGVVSAQAGEIVRLEASRPTAGGDPRWWDILLAPLAGPGGTHGRLVCMSRDITGHRSAIEAKDLMMMEIHHRVKNSLQLVQNLLSLQGRATDNAQAREQLLESATRVRTISAIHDQLYKTGAALMVEVGPYLQGLVADIQSGMASTLDNRPIRVQADEVTWPAVEMPTLGLILTELVTNALKYGEGAVEISFSQPVGTAGILTVSDAGRSLPEDFQPAQSRGLGMRLIKGLLRGGDAGLEVDRSGGHTRFVARMPPPRTMAS